MAYIDSIHSAKKGFESICGFGNTFLCNGGISQNKTVTFPNGWDNDTNLSFKVIFKEGHNCADDSTHMTLNNIAVVVNQHGTLIPLPIHTFVESGTTVYKSLQPNTVLEMYYTDNYDGSNTPAFVVVGNPIVLSSADYTIYANGYIDYDAYSKSEVKTNKIWIDGKPIYRCVIPFQQKVSVASIFYLTIGGGLPSNVPFTNFDNISNFISSMIYRNDLATVIPVAVQYSSATQIQIFCFNNFENTDGIVLEYTKI